MLDTLTQLIATTGPIALAIMGVVVSLNPPNPSGRAHLIWAGVFVVVGLITAFSLFRELRGTDESLNKIWGKISSPIGPRLEFAGIKTNESEGGVTPILKFSNTRDIDATGHYLVGNFLITEEDNSDIETTISETKKKIVEQNIRGYNGMPLSRGMGAEFPLGKIPSEYISLIESGKRRAYVIAIAIYIDANTPDDHVWVTELCAKITKLFSDFQSCPAHNGYFYSDKSLSQIH